MGGGESVIDQTFFDYTNTSSFNDLIVSEVIKPQYKIDLNCLNRIKEEVDMENKDLTWFASPNPCINNITLRCDDDIDKAIIKIFTQSGQLVKAVNIDYFNGMIRLDLSSLSSGIYTLNISAGNKNSGILKVIKR